MKWGIAEATPEVKFRMAQPKKDAGGCCPYLQEGQLRMHGHLIKIYGFSADLQSTKRYIYNAYDGVAWSVDGFVGAASHTLPPAFTSTATASPGGCAG